MIKLYEEFNKESKVKREYWDNNQIRIEKWVLNGVLHRENGPAYQSWNKNGQKKSEYWLLDGELHRENGPACQSWYEDGQKKYENWWLNGKVSSREEWVKELDKIGSEYYDEQRILLNAEKYNL